MSDFAPSSSGVAWIDDDAQLRDEGILFGLAEIGAPDTKEASIRSYFDEQVAACARQRPELEQHEREAAERRAALTVEIVSMEKRLLDAREAEAREPEPPETVELVRYGVGLGLAVAMCVLNAFLIHEFLSDSIQEKWLVTFALVSAGMFTLFPSIAAVYRSEASQHASPEAPERWKVWVAELVPATAAALFAVVWSEEDTLVHTVANFTYVAALFIFGGKLFLSLLPKLGQTLRARRHREEMEKRAAALRAEYQELVNRREGLDRQVETLRERRLRLPSEAELRQTCERKIQLFRSEYDLARAAGRRMGLVEDAGVAAAL